MLLAQSFGDHLDLVIELALEHHALVDDCRHAVQELATRGQIACLRLSQ
ncbi:MAG: hypothetical protein IPI06_10075 [Gammaproteobacteria bacterium]|nr:hypothetical protein [Gammaproteobacteria bacterium]